MLRNAMVILASTLVLGGSALSSSAFAGGAGHGAGGGPGPAGFRGNHSAGAEKKVLVRAVERKYKVARRARHHTESGRHAFGGGRTIGDGSGGYRGRVSGLPGGVPAYSRSDVWSHWGAYYGPMVYAP